MFNVGKGDVFKEAFAICAFSSSFMAQRFSDILVSIPLRFVGISIGNGQLVFSAPRF